MFRFSAPDESGGLEMLPDGTLKRTLEIPDTLALLPIRDLVVFPYMVVPLLVSREISVAAVHEALATKDRLIMLAAQRDPGQDEPGPDQLHTLGTIGMVMRMRKLSDGRIKILAQGLMRARIRDVVRQQPCYVVRAERVAEIDERTVPNNAEAEALLRSVKDDLQKYAQGGKLVSPELMLVMSRPRSRSAGAAPCWW